MLNDSIDQFTSAIMDWGGVFLIGTLPSLLRIIEEIAYLGL